MERIDSFEYERGKENAKAQSDSTIIFSKERGIEENEAEIKIDRWNKLIVNNRLLGIEEKWKKLEKIKSLETITRDTKDIYAFFSKEKNWAKNLFKKTRDIKENPKWDITMKLIEWIIVFFLNDKKSLSNFKTINWNWCFSSPSNIMGKQIKIITINRIGIKEHKKSLLKNPLLAFFYSQKEIQKYENTTLKEKEEKTLAHEIQHYNNGFLIDYENGESFLSAIQDEIIAQAVHPSSIWSNIASEICKIFSSAISEGIQTPDKANSSYSHANWFYDWNMDKYYKNQIFVMENLDKWTNIACNLKKAWIKDYADILAITPLDRRPELEKIYLKDSKKCTID